MLKYDREAKPLLEELASHMERDKWFVLRESKGSSGSVASIITQKDTHRVAVRVFVSGAKTLLQIVDIPKTPTVRQDLDKMCGFFREAEKRRLSGPAAIEWIHEQDPDYETLTENLHVQLIFAALQVSNGAPDTYEMALQGARGDHLLTDWSCPPLEHLFPLPEDSPFKDARKK